MIIPQKHLLTNEENDKVYYTRLADELLRHRRVHLFMFYPEHYLNIQSQEFQLTKEEFLTTKPSLHSEFFKQLKKHPYGDYARNIPYDQVVVS